MPAFLEPPLKSGSIGAMSELVIRARLVRFLVGDTAPAVTVSPAAIAEVTQAAAEPEALVARAVVEVDDGVDGRAALTMVSGWFLAPPG